jgi:chemotaxis response regulator CheB
MLTHTIDRIYHGIEIPLTEKKITVLLADDHPVTRAGIRAILNTAPDIQVIGEAASGFDVQEMLEELLPQILLLDLQMPEPRPSELEAWVRQNYPEVVTLVLTEHIPVKHEKWHLLCLQVAEKVPLFIFDGCRRDS